MSTDNASGRLISFDEAGFTGPQLLDEHQPFFVYASHDLTDDEAASLVSNLRDRYRLQGKELKSNRPKRRDNWPKIANDLCVATKGRSKLVVHDKKAALAGKFFEYFFEPVLANNSALFYGAEFHRYVMSSIYVLMNDGAGGYDELAKQMQAFMRTFDPAVAPGVFSNDGSHPVEMERILRFCRGYATRISAETEHLRPDENGTGKWTLDLTSTALFSLLFHGWGHVYARLRLLCDESKPLASVAEFFNAWVGRDQATQMTDGKTSYSIRGNLVAPVEFGSSDTHATIQVADLLAGMAMDAAMKGATAEVAVQEWLQRHQLHSHSISYLPEFTRPGDKRVKLGREILKELALRADSNADPLEGMGEFVRRVRLRFQ